MNKVFADRGQRSRTVSVAPGDGCFCCGKQDHKCAQCKFKEYTCHGCGQQGHLKRLCHQVKGGKSSKPPKGPRIKTVETENDSDEEIATIGLVGHGNKPIYRLRSSWMVSHSVWSWTQVPVGAQLVAAHSAELGKAVRTGDLSAMLEQNAVVFGQELGELKGYTTSIHVEPRLDLGFVSHALFPMPCRAK